MFSRSLATRAMVAAGALALLAVAGYGGYRLSTRTRAVEIPFDTVAVARGNLTTSWSATGVAVPEREAFIHFGSADVASSVVRTVDVKLGDHVVAGQPLVTLDARAASAALDQARVGLDTARTSLQQASAGAPASVAAAAQAVATASALLSKSQNDLASLRRGAEPADIAAARQAVFSAQNALATAQSTLDAQQGRADAHAQAAAVQQQIDGMTAQLNGAEARISGLLAAADNGRFVRPVLDDLMAAIDERCDDIGNRASCMAVAISTSDLRALVDGLSSTTRGERNLVDLHGAVVSGAGDLSSTLAGPAFQQAQALAARPGLQMRHDALLPPYTSPTGDDLPAAVRARDAAAAALKSAEERLRKLTGGASQGDLATAEEAARSARVALDSALAAQASVGDGGTSVVLRQQQVLAAEVAVRQAENALADTIVRAPFDGVVGAVLVSPGAAVVPGAPVTRLTNASAVSVQFTVSEYERSWAGSGQPGIARFDALPGSRFVVELAGAGASPLAATGPVTYGVRARIITGQELRSRSALITALVPLLKGNPTGGNLDPAVLADRLGAQPLPLPGMSAIVTIPREVHDVLLVPAEAVHRVSGRSVVKLQGPQAVVDREVRLGATDGSRYEVISGLKEGDRVLVESHETNGRTRRVPR